MSLSDEIIAKHEKFVKKVTENNKDFIKRLTDYVISKMDKGTLQSGKYLAELEIEIRKLLKDSGYIQALEDFLKFGDEIKSQTLSVYNNPELKSVFAKSERVAFYESIANDSLRGGGLNESVVKRIANQIRQGAFNNVNLDSVRAIVQGFENILPKYVSQVSYDTHSQLHGALQSEIKEKYNTKKGRYVGSLIESSRPFCNHLIGLKNPITETQLKIALNKYCPDGEPKEGIGNGMIKGTTIDNFSVNRGGYQCRHLWVWILD